MAEILKRDDITQNVIIIKINKSYKSGMDAERLYDVTRGCWKVSIPYTSQADYALSVVFGEVIEVYKIFEWVPAFEERRKTIEYDAEKEKGRIIFKGCILRRRADTGAFASGHSAAAADSALISYFPFNHYNVVFCYTLKQGVG